MYFEPFNLGGGKGTRDRQSGRGQQGERGNSWQQGGGSGRRDNQTICMRLVVRGQTKPPLFSQQ